MCSIIIPCDSWRRSRWPWFLGLGIKHPNGLVFATTLFVRLIPHNHEPATTASPKYNNQITPMFTFMFRSSPASLRRELGENALAHTLSSQLSAGPGQPEVRPSPSPSLSPSMSFFLSIYLSIFLFFFVEKSLALSSLASATLIAFHSLLNMLNELPLQKNILKYDY
jgi:hypothetical protein